MSTETQVAAHYGRTRLIEAIDAALVKAGKDPQKLSPEDLAPVDEFHIRGRAATAELGAHLNLRAGDKLLDVGSGLGGPSRQLAVTYGCDVTGIDLTGEYCAVANELARRLGLAGRVRYRQGSALAMPFGDAAFDAAMTQHVAMNIADKAGLYREVRRVLRAGGRFGIYDLLQGEGGTVHFPVPWARDASTSFLATPEEMRLFLHGAGFEITSWIDSSEIGREWFRAVSARIAEKGQPVLGFHLLMGEDFAEMARNQMRNLMEDRVRPTEIVCVAI
ncbi:MAG: methyltransferase domain-containing protein [Pseudorhodoplanes sp.]|nr:methyltransferase domain-containing protein [Pseudorhodoplanes sp.]